MEIVSLYLAYYFGISDDGAYHFEYCYSNDEDFETTDDEESSPTLSASPVAGAVSQVDGVNDGSPRKRARTDSNVRSNLM